MASGNCSKPGEEILTSLDCRANLRTNHLLDCRESGKTHSFILIGSSVLNTAEKARALTETEVARLGYELVDVEFKKEQSAWVLTFFIDKDGGVTVDDCEQVSRAVEPILDEADPIEQSYYLSVSSPGLDRPLKTVRDFQRYMGKPVMLKLYAKIDGKKEFSGELKNIGEATLTLCVNEKEEKVFQRKDIALVKPEISF
jgi:ribosome maturation factor RimP